MGKKTVYMSFSTDVIHGGHISIIEKAAKLGDLMIGALTDEAIASYRRFPLLSYAERVKVLSAIKGVKTIVPQSKLSYKDNLRKYKPDFVVHGDDWLTGDQKPIREGVIATLNEYGGELIEYPYSQKEEYEKIELSQREQLSMPDVRRSRLKRLLEMKPLLRILEAHNGLTGLIAEQTVVTKDGNT